MRRSGVVIVCALVVAACGSNDAPSTAEVRRTVESACIRGASGGVKASAEVTSACDCAADYILKHATVAQVTAMERSKNHTAARKFARAAAEACT